MKKNTKEFILLEAFKLFGTMTYEQVTYNELEAATGLTRGTVMYYFKTKELLFKSVFDKYVLEDGSIFKKLDAKIKSDISLKDFLSLFIDVIVEMKGIYKNYGFINMNKPLINMTNQAIYYYPNSEFEFLAAKWEHRQIDLWRNVLKKSVINGEIKTDINIDAYAELFEDVYCGVSYAGLAFPSGIQIDRLRTAFDIIYDSIKNSTS